LHFSLVFNFGCGVPPTNSPITNNNANTVVNSTPANVQQCRQPQTALRSSTRKSDGKHSKGNYADSRNRSRYCGQEIKPGEKIPGSPTPHYQKTDDAAVNHQSCRLNFAGHWQNQNVGPSANVNAAPSMMMKKKPQ